MILANNCNMRKLGIFACRLVSKHCQLKYLESTSTCQQNVMKICTVKMYALIQFFLWWTRHRNVIMWWYSIRIFLNVNQRNRQSWSRKYKYKTQIQQTHVKWQVRLSSLPQSERRDNLEVANILKLQSSSSSPFLLFPLILSTSRHATFLKAGIHIQIESIKARSMGGK